LANARPEWDLRYFSNSSALYLSGKAQYQVNFQGFDFCGVRGLAGIVVGHPPLQVGSRAAVFLVGGS
jgi:hypothetical protein